MSIEKVYRRVGLSLVCKLYRKNMIECIDDYLEELNELKSMINSENI